MLRAVDRADFTPGFLPPQSIYRDSPLPIGYGATISAPHMHAFALVFADNNGTA